MLKEAIDRIIELATPQTYQIGEDTYTINRNMTRVDPHVDRPQPVGFASLDGIVKAVQTEIGRVTRPVFINIKSHDEVRVFTTYRDDLERDMLYNAKPDLPDRAPVWMGHDDAMIALRSCFIETEDTAYILDLLASITDDNSVRTTDNGLTQTVNVRQGVSLREKAVIKPRVVLRPFRTFLEVDQPASEFLLRLKKGDPEKGREAVIGLIEADGGAWKLAAKHNIAEYFRRNLSGLIEDCYVIVTE